MTHRDGVRRRRIWAGAAGARRACQNGESGWRDGVDTAQRYPGRGIKGPEMRNSLGLEPGQRIAMG